MFAIIIAMNVGCSNDSGLIERHLDSGSVSPKASTYVNLLDFDDYQRFWWVVSNGLEAHAINQLSEADVLYRLAVCESAPGFVCFYIQPEFPLNVPCQESDLSKAAFPDEQTAELVSQFDSAYQGLPEYVFEIGAGSTRMRVAYVYSVGITSFLYLQEETIREGDTVYVLPKTNAIYVATDNPFDPMGVLCSK